MAFIGVSAWHHYKRTFDARTLMADAIRMLLQAIPYSLRPRERGHPMGEECHIKLEHGRVWYHKSGGGDAMPILLLHGGPGAAAYYLEPLEECSWPRLPSRD